jgi:hypothetical protein
MSDLTGLWIADDGTRYAVRQVDDKTLWFAGFDDDGGLQRGLTLTCVFQGARQGNVITGTWAHVPRGIAMSSGSLVLAVDADNAFHKVSCTGCFSGTTWTLVGASDAQRTLHDLFNTIAKNAGDSLLDNLKPLRDCVVAWGSVNTADNQANLMPLAVDLNIDPSAPKTYDEFLAIPNGGDGDVTFNVGVDLTRLPAQFFDSSPLWESNADVSSVKAKIDNSNQIHAELVMFARQKSGATATSLLPAWGEPGSNSVLVNGRPMAGIVDGIALGSNWMAISVGGVPIGVGTQVRVTGPMVLDCGHADAPGSRDADLGILDAFLTPFDFIAQIVEATPGHHSCHDDEADIHNVEIHPVYAVDIITASDATTMTGVWGDSTGLTMYVHEIDGMVWGLAMGPYRSFLPVTAFLGKRTGNAVSGTWVDLPPTTRKATGSATLTLNGLGFDADGPFAGSWQKLYDSTDATPRLRIKSLNLVLPGQPVSFEVDTSGLGCAAVSYAWSTSDGHAGTEPIFALAAVGSANFTVTVQISDADGCIETTSRKFYPNLDQIIEHIERWQQGTGNMERYLAGRGEHATEIEVELLQMLRSVKKVVELISRPPPRRHRH